ncbi:MAG: nucleotidyltransferase family protein [Parvibaculum sp.]
MTEAEFLVLIRRNPVNGVILERLDSLGLSDAWLVSGCLFQTVWNVLTERPVSHGIKDYDIFYFDPDTSWEAEDNVIKRGNALFADLAVPIEFRNQARVHLWYSEKHGRPYPPLTSSCEGIDRFLAVANMVGVNPKGDVYGPGLADMATMHLRPNRTANFRKDRYDEKNVRYKACWPELTIEAA